MNQFILLVMVALLGLYGCAADQKKAVLSSPDGNLSVEFNIDKGNAYYLLSLNNALLLDTSFIGFEFKDELSLDSDFKMLKTKQRTFSDTWEMPWGEQRYVKNNYNELTIYLKQTGTNRLINIVFRVFNDGIGFRYEFPIQKNWDEVIITDENTEFNLTGDHMCWWIPGDWDIYEHLYKTTRLSEINALKYKNPPLAQSYIPYNAVNTPVTLKSDEGVYLSFHEANLTDYAGMTLKVDSLGLGFISELVGNDSGIKVKRKLPFETPWRTVQVAKRAGDLIESKLILNLNEPNKLGDVSWFKPTKYAGIWWDMNLGTKTWDYESGNHGATTDYAKEMIDFAAENSIGAVLVEGWNTGWEQWYGTHNREGIFDFITPYPDYNLQEVVGYGRSKGVELIMHHETSAAIRTYEQQLDTAYALMKSLGIHAVKTGYVGQILPDGEYHHGQWMVNHYRKVVEHAAKHQVAVNAHEPIKATGIRRTYPNVISREGLRGQEFNAWSADGGNPPEHLSIVAFTRMLGGPIDFTPGIFNIKLKPYKEKNQVNTTLAHQLALYVVLYSPVQMVPDLIENYIGKPEFQFIRDVGVNWDESKVLFGDIGDYVGIARKERDTENWFVGVISDEKQREIEISFDFLEDGKVYTATVYKDAHNAHWDNNPESCDILIREIVKQDLYTLLLAPGGGVAISLYPKNN